MDSLESRIRYRFRDPALLEEALTHASMRHEARETPRDNQRLEFLGDAVLDLVLSEALYQRLPDRDEGVMTKLRTRLVSEGALAKMARNLGLGNFLKINRSAEITGCRDRDSTLADALEALIGAVYLDGTLEAARAMILDVSGSELQVVLAKPVDVNPKGELQELLQGLTAITPAYAILREEGPAHERLFQAIVTWNGHRLGEGVGPSKKEAEIAAAEAALAGTELKELVHRINLGQETSKISVV